MALIELEAAIKRIKEYALNAYGIDLDDSIQFSGSSLSENYCEGLLEAIELIDDIPAIDTAPVVHGKWISPYTLDCHCSVCGEQPEREQGESVPLYDYCPYCGARMDGGEGHGL